MTIDDMTEDIAMPGFVVVNHLPEQGEQNTIYIKSGMMWIYLDCWKELGMVETDLSSCYTKTQVDEVINGMVVEEKRGKCPNCGAPLENGHCQYCGCA